MTTIFPFPPKPDGSDPDRERHLTALRRLSELGMETVELLAEAQRRAKDDKLPELALAFARVSRMVHQTITLEIKVRDEQVSRAVDLQAAGMRRARRQDLRFAADKEERITQAERIAANALIADIEDNQRDLDSVMTDLRDRLVHDEDYDELAGRSIVELALRLCQDLGVKPDWGTVLREPPAPRGKGSDDPGARYGFERPKRTPPEPEGEEDEWDEDEEREAGGADPPE